MQLVMTFTISVTFSMLETSWRLEFSTSLIAVSITLKLIQLTLEKVTLTGENVGKITADSSQLGEHIQVIDTAIFAG